VKLAVNSSFPYQDDMGVVRRDIAADPDSL